MELEECVVLVWKDLRLMDGSKQMKMELARKFLECQDIKKSCSGDVPRLQYSVQCRGTAVTGSKYINPNDFIQSEVL